MATVLHNWPSDVRLWIRLFFHMLIVQYYLTLFLLIVISSFYISWAFSYSVLHNLWSCKSYLYMQVPLQSAQISSYIFSTLTLKKNSWFEYNRDNSKTQRLKTKESAEIKGKAAKRHDSSFCYFLGCNLWNQCSFWKFPNFLPLQSKIYSIHECWRQMVPQNNSIR